MRLFDNTKMVEIRIQKWNGNGYDPDWSQDFFEAAGLEFDEEKNAYRVDDVDYCIEQANDMKNHVGDFYDGEDPDEDMEIFIEEIEEGEKVMKGEGA